MRKIGAKVYCMLIVLLTRRFISRPAKLASSQLSEILTNIENQQGNLTARVSVVSQNEIGDLVMGINMFLERLQDIMSKINQESGNIQSSVKKISGGITISDESVINVSAVMEEAENNGEISNHLQDEVQRFKKL